MSVALLITKHLLGTAPVLPLVFLQLAASTAAVWTLAGLTGRLPSLAQLPRLGFPGLLQPGLAYVLGFLGLAVTPVGVEGLLFAFETPLVVLLAWPLLGERPGVPTLLCAAAATLGAVVVGGAEAPSGPVPLAGVLLILGGVLAASLDTVVCRGLMSDADPLGLTAASHLGGLLVVGAALAIWPATGWGALLSPATLPLALGSGILLHGAATLLFNFGLARVAAGAASILLPLISVITAAGGYAAFGERLSMPQLWGGVLTIASATAMGLWARKDPDPRSKHAP